MNREYAASDYGRDGRVGYNPDHMADYLGDYITHQHDTFEPCMAYPSDFMYPGTWHMAESPLHASYDTFEPSSPIQWSLPPPLWQLGRTGFISASYLPSSFGRYLPPPQVGNCTYAGSAFLPLPPKAQAPFSDVASDTHVKLDKHGHKHGQIFSSSGSSATTSKQKIGPIDVSCAATSSLTSLCSRMISTSVCDVEDCDMPAFCQLSPCGCSICRDHLGISLRSVKRVNVVHERKDRSAKLYKCTKCGAISTTLLPLEWILKKENQDTPPLSPEVGIEISPTVSVSMCESFGEPQTPSPSPSPSSHQSPAPFPFPITNRSPRHRNYLARTSLGASVAIKSSPLLPSLQNDSSSPRTGRNIKRSKTVSVPPDLVRPKPLRGKNLAFIGREHAGHVYSRSLVWPVVKIENIPFNLTVPQVEKWLPAGCLPPANLVPMPIHIVLHRATGRTLPHAYVELVSIEAMLYLMTERNMKSFGDRTVKLKFEKKGELLRDLFCQEEYFRADTSTSTGFHLAALPRPPLSSETCHINVDAVDLAILLARCLQPEHPRRCNFERGFLNIASLIAKFPWALAEEYAGALPDAAFSCVKAAIRILRLTRISLDDQKRIATTLVNYMTNHGHRNNTKH